MNYNTGESSEYCKYVPGSQIPNSYIFNILGHLLAITKTYAMHNYDMHFFCTVHIFLCYVYLFKSAEGQWLISIKVLKVNDSIKNMHRAKNYP